MSISKLIKIFLASTIALPLTFSAYGTASAQKVISRQNIVNSLQRRKKVRSNRSSVRVNRARQRRAPRIQQRRAPARQNVQLKFRAPPATKRRAPARAPQQTVNTFRAPGRAPARARAPQQNVNTFRAPAARAPVARAPQQNANLKFRAPPRAPRARAPQQNANLKFRAPPRAPQRARVPQQANNQPQLRRAPNRNPQQFNQQVATNNDNGRAIRVEQQPQRQFPNLDNASVDLEILFDYNSDKISPESLRQLLILGEALHDASLLDSRIMIAGHTDAAGSRSYNNDLSSRRARAVSDFLVNYTGINAARLFTEGYGEDYLKYPDAPNSGQNRRVEIINMGK